MKHLSRFELDEHKDGPLYHAPGSFAAGAVAGLGAAILWAIWWPLGVLGIILAYCVCLCATQVQRSTAHYDALDAAANVNRGPGAHVVDTPPVGPAFDPPTWNGRRHTEQTDVF